MRAAAIGLALVVLLAAGCGGGRRTPEVARASGEGFPVAVTDAQGVEVRIKAPPRRIVSTAPAVTEILFALGAGERVAAVTDQCTYPPEAAERPKVGGFWTPSLERTLGARPDLVIGSRGNPPDFVSPLRRSGVPVVTVDPQTMRDIFATIEQIARIIGDPAAGDRLASEMQARLDAVARRIGDVPEGERPTAFLVLQVTPLWTGGSGTFQHDAIEAAGGRNIAADLRSFKPYGTESLLAQDPDVLLLSTMDGDRERMKREVMANPALRRLSAVQNGRMVVMESDPLMRAGPRIVEAVEAMAAAFYPERFGVEPAGG